MSLAFNQAVLAFDIETSGSSLSENGIVSIGASLQDENSNELASFQVNLDLPTGKTYDKRCFEDFWSKHPEAYNFVNKDPLPPKEAMMRFCKFLESTEVGSKDSEVTLVSDNPSFDIAWLNMYLSLYTDRQPLNCSSTGKHRMIWDSCSIQKIWLSLKTGDFPAPSKHTEKLSLVSKWPRDHTSLNDARRIAQFYNDTIKEMKKFIGSRTQFEEKSPESIKDKAIAKKIEVVPYNAEWPKMFQSEKASLESVLGEYCINIFHIGSTSVPGLSAKPLIDMIAIVSSIKDAREKILSRGYQFKGEYNIPFSYLFGKKEPFEVHLHVYEDGDNPEIQLNLLFRDFLRSSPQSRKEYSDLKASLLAKKSSHEIVSGKFSGYNLGKNEFIKRILGATGFKGLCPRLCTHYTEWEAYNRICEAKSKRTGIPYKRIDEKSVSENNFYFVLYEGTTIVAVAHLELLNSVEAALRFLGTEELPENRNYDSHFMLFLEKWIKTKNREIVKTQAILLDVDFFKAHGYVEMPFNEPPSSGAAVVELGKRLN